VPISAVLFAPNGPLYQRLPNTFVYENIGTIRQAGIEVSLEHSFSRDLTGFANYSWQDEPEPRDDVGDPNRYPTSEISLPPQNRFNLGLNYNGKKFLGALAVNYADDALWTDVLTQSTHGFTDSYTMVNATFGVKFMDGRVTTSVKGTNLTNDEIQQHIFGDILKRSLMGEVRFTF
jgi:outer membrane receptor for ferric coprogen and ferric-rhodotorulic acid